VRRRVARAVHSSEREPVQTGVPPSPPFFVQNLQVIGLRGGPGNLGLHFFRALRGVYRQGAEGVIDAQEMGGEGGPLLRRAAN
jgi:hypothetical protein